MYEMTTVGDYHFLQTIEPSTTAGTAVAITSASSSTTKSTVEPITSTTSAIVTNLIYNHQNKRPHTLIIYPTVSPESIVIPIVSCIFGFPILALLVICCLRHRAKMARERDRRRINDLQDVAGLSLVRFSPLHGLHGGSKRALTMCNERGILSRGFASLELDTVIEERSDFESTQVTDLITPDSPTTNANTRLNEILEGS